MPDKAAEMTALHSAAVVTTIQNLFKSIEVKLGSIQPSPTNPGMLEVNLLVKQPANPAKVAGLVQFAQVALADHKLTPTEILGLLMLAAG